MRASILLGIWGICATTVSAGEVVQFHIHGQAWNDFGRIMQASDSELAGGTTVNTSSNSMQSLGAQFTVDAEWGEHWNAVLGIGAYQMATALGTVGGTPEASDFLNVSLMKPISQASLTYYEGLIDHPWLSITAGNFAYDYNPDVKDLGLYLLRGPVYPGLLMSGFQQFETDTTKAVQTGFRVHNAIGNFSQDLLLINEQELPPMFDWSLAYVAKYRAFNALEIGAGVNFYRLIPYSNALETPGRFPYGQGSTASDGTPNYDVVSPDDTVFYTDQGIKLMGMFSLDPKRWLPFENMGSEDFKLYGEAAVLGVKNYGSLYNDIWQRIPVMGGFNVPTFGILDFLSVEVEWYGSPYRDDLSNLGNPASIVAPWMNQNPPIPSPVPVEPGAYPDSVKDNWKWAVVAQKTVAKHIRFTAQIANDHFRPGPLVSDGTGTTTTGGAASVLTAPSDWYFMCRLGFFF